MKNNVNRCEFSGEAIGNKPAVLVKNVISYVKKMGYLVSNMKFLIFIFMFLMFVSPVLAIPTEFTFDLNSRINIVVSALILIGASILAFMGKNQRLISAFLFVIVGFLFLFNGLNVLLVFILISLGVVIIFI